MSGVEVRLDSIAPAAESDRLVFTLVDDVCRWIRTPDEWCGGRSAWQVLDNTALPTRALKFKGLGQQPAEGQAAVLPSNERFDRWPGQPPDEHFGIDGDLEFVLLDGDPAPLGGLTLAGARREFDCATELNRSKVPSALPIAVYEYIGRTMATSTGTEPLGISVTGNPVRSSLRCNAIVPSVAVDATAPEIASEAGRISRALGFGNQALHPLLLLRESYRRHGTTLRAFTDAGWYRYSSHPDNIVIDDGGRSVLIDLDSCRPCTREDQLALQGVRDGMSALYNLACTFFRWDVLDTVSDEELREFEPFSGFLIGWSSIPESAARAFGVMLTNYVIESREQLRHFSCFLTSDRPQAQHLYRYVRHERDLTFALLYRMAFAIRQADPAAARLPFDLGALDDRLLRFAGRQRFERAVTLTEPLLPAVA